MSDDFQCDLTPISSSGEARTLSPSSSDDMSSPNSRVLISPPASICPNPAYIAASAASQIVTNDHELNADSWFEQAGIEPSGETALVAPAALRLVNSFLDQLLYNVLATARSTSLSVLRPAVREVLRPKLAAEAIGGADEELHEYLGGGEDEELLAYHNGQEPAGEWDLDLVWKRTRLRCMVYSSLGDMEEEDEDLWAEKEQLHTPYASDESSAMKGLVVSPAVAIFLTSILEFMGERALIVAGGTAYQRLRITYETPERDGSSSPCEIADRVVVDELDVERVGLDRTLGRLWRGWKKALRSTPSSPRQSQRELSSKRGSSHYTSRRTSLGNETPEEDDDDEDDMRVSPPLDPIDHEYAATIPLPMSDNDIEEIQTPWLRLYPDDIPVRPVNSRLSSVRSIKRRPMSLMIFPSADRGLPTPEKSEPNSPMFRALLRSNSHTGQSPSTSTFKDITGTGSEAQNKEYSTPTSYENVSTVTNSNVVEPLIPDYATPLVAADEIAPLNIRKASAVSVERQPSLSNNDPEQNIDSEAREVTGASFVRADESTVDKDTANTSIISSLGFVAGATAMATATVASVMALAGKSDANIDEKSNDVDGEVPEIVTSSRVSVDNSKLGIARNPSIRSISSHSLRVVDIPARSRHNSMDASDILNRRASPILRASTTSPIMRKDTTSPINIGYSRSAGAYKQDKQEKQERGSEGSRESISEEDEDEKEVKTQPTKSVRPIETSVTPIPVPNKSPLRETVAQFPSSSIDASLASTTTSMTHENLSAFDASTPSRVYTRPDNDVSQTLQTPARATGVPQLTPLRELVEGAADTSDEASSATRSAEHSRERLHDDEPMEGIAPLRTIVPEKSTTSPSTIRDDDQTPTPETFSRNLRQVPTTSSATSQKMKAIRKSEESSKSNGPSFEELMQSDKTIQYTLTPSSVRGIESQKTSEAANRKSPAHSPSASLHSSSKRLTTGLNSNPTNLPKSASQPNVQPTQPRSTPTVQARDARVEPPENVGDFADFIRTTGPSNETFSSGAAIPINNSKAIRDYDTMAVQQRNVSAPVPSGGVIFPNVTRVSRSASNARLLARDAVVPYGGSSSELIDFIRQGPPSTRANPRIPRTVAPFRTTMDSEQMVNAMSRVVEPDVNNSRNSEVSTTTSVQQSLHNSVNSQSALLNNYQQKFGTQTEPQNPFEDNMPKRKTRRVKDPYAIDYSDDEDGEIDYIQTDKPVRVEESLMDFLNAGPLGAGPQTTSIFDNAMPPSQQRKLVKKNSSGSLMSRFSHKDSTSGPVSSQTTSFSKQPTMSTNGYGTIPQSPPYNANYVSALGSDRKLSSQQQRIQQQQFVPREAAVPISKYRSDTDELADFLLNTAPTAAIGGSLATGPNLAMKRQEAAMLQQQQQKERQRQSPQPQHKSGGFSSIFGRRKKVA